jgi:hypothetical protein
MLFESIDDELAKIDPSKYYMNFGDILPDEEPIGEMNDFEKKAMIWMALEAEKSKEDLRNHEALFANIDLKTAKHLAEEAESKLEIVEFLQKRVFKSLVERFELDKKLFVIKGNFQVVLSNKKNQEAELKRLENIFHSEVASLVDKKTSHDN